MAPSPPTAAVAAATSLTSGCGAFPTDRESDGFLCDADGMGIEGAVPAVRDAEALRAGQIYFVLCAAAACAREEFAALAIRASAVLSSRATSAAAPGLPLSLPLLMRASGRPGLLKRSCFPDRPGTESGPTGRAWAVG